MIVVVGATGRVGGTIARALLAEGREVRAFVRPTSDRGPLEEAGAEIVLGDLEEPGTIPPAVEGASAVITTATAALRGDEESIDAVDRRGTARLIDAAAREDVERFVYVSAFGIAEAAGLALARAKRLSEQRLRMSGMGYTILRPTLLMESWIGSLIGGQLEEGDTVTLLGDGRTRHGFVAVGDVAAVARAVLGMEETRDTALTVGGPSATFREVVALVERVSGREIRLRRVDDPTQLEGFPPIVGEIWDHLNEAGDAPEDLSGTARSLGVEPTGLEEFVAERFGAGSRPRG